jgi:hypothetical protein
MHGLLHVGYPFVVENPGAYLYIDWPIHVYCPSGEHPETWQAKTFLQARMSWPIPLWVPMPSAGIVGTSERAFWRIDSHRVTSPQWVSGQHCCCELLRHIGCGEC